MNREVQKVYLHSDRFRFAHGTPWMPSEHEQLGDEQRPDDVIMRWTNPGWRVEGLDFVGDEEASAYAATFGRRVFIIGMTDRFIDRRSSASRQV